MKNAVEFQLQIVASWLTIVQRKLKLAWKSKSFIDSNKVR